MKVSIQKRIGKSLVSFESDHEDFKMALAEVIKKSDAPEASGLCKSTDLALRQYVTKTGNYLYVKIKCNACQASSTLGQGLKDKNNFWWKEFEKFEKREEAETIASPVAPTNAPVADEINLDDLPF